jgi:hypothetical protein
MQAHAKAMNAQIAACVTGQLVHASAQKGGQHQMEMEGKGAEVTAVTLVIP